jgi:GT2 family glycosyltransferase
MLQGGNFVVDRTAMIAAGGFDKDVEFYGEDTVTAKRLSKLGKVKFDLGLYCISSARRFAAEGLIRIGTRYALNYAWVSITGRPFSRTHDDHREAS